MKTSIRKRSAAIAGVALVAVLLNGCGSDSPSNNDATAPAPTAGAPTGATTAGVPDNTGDSPSLFMAFVKSMASADDTSEPLIMPAALKDAMADDTGPPLPLGT